MITIKNPFVYEGARGRGLRGRVGGVATEGMKSTLVADMLVFLEYSVLGIFFGGLVFHHGCHIHQLNSGEIYVYMCGFIIGGGRHRVVLRL
jgi:hypothetical protein